MENAKSGNHNHEDEDYGVAVPEEIKKKDLFFIDFKSLDNLNTILYNCKSTTIKIIKKEVDNL